MSLADSSGGIDWFEQKDYKWHLWWVDRDGEAHWYTSYQSMFDQNMKDGIEYIKKIRKHDNLEIYVVNKVSGTRIDIVKPKGDE